MHTDEKLPLGAQSLIEGEQFLRRVAEAYPASLARAFGGIGRVVQERLRIGILGESNSGKSSLANLLVGAPALPAHPVTNTALPTLLTYAPEPYVAVAYEDGDRVPLSVGQSISEIVSGFYKNSNGAFRNKSPRSKLKWLEVGLPSDILRSIEILDFPSNASALFPASREAPETYGLDAAIWTTVATQAWRETERTEWLRLPESIRSRGLLAVTYCDMVTGGQGDLKRLQARLETSAKPYFRELCFVAAGGENPADLIVENQVIFVQVLHLALEFAVSSLGEAAPSATPEEVLKRLFPETGSAPPMGLAEDWMAFLLGRPTEINLDKPSILLGDPAPVHASQATAQRPQSRPAPRRRSSRADGPSKAQLYQIGIAAALLLAGAALLGAFQLGVFSSGKRQVSSPAADSVNESAKRSAERLRRLEQEEAAEAERIRKAAAEAAEAERIRKAAAEAAEAERIRKAAAEAAEAERIRKAEEEAAELRRRKRVEAIEAEKRKRAEAESAEAERQKRAEAAEAEKRKRVEERKAAPTERQPSSAPIMHGVVQ